MSFLTFKILLFSLVGGLMSPLVGGLMSREHNALQRDPAVSLGI